WGVIIPLIKVFGLGSADVFPSNVPINSMSSDQIWSSYVRYIGAGTLVVGGLISLIKLTPLFYRTIHLSVKELFSGFSARAHLKRTEKDISMAWLSLGSIAVILILWLLPTLPMNFLTIVLLVILAFFFVGVTSITVGIVGSTSNPVSGMTILTILIACLVFLLLGWTDRLYLISAITMSCVACSAICIAGTTAQDLKTGFLLGATPRSQQIAEILGVFLPALSLGYVIYILDASYHIGSASMPAPQATMISMIAKGTISGDLPYTLFGIGIMIGVLMALIRVPILPFALGVYLPLSLSTAMIFGALVKAYVDRKTYQETMQERGILLAAGLIGGDACIGIILALLTVSGILSSDAPSILPDGVSFLAYVLLACFLGFFASRKSK
ncbi:MAG: oligopeptide transporter, OPT family, partial [Chlamydiae bacterium]|nr:oligopeptide transporter, OPT family [Chlamydiota bacterium]